MLISKIQWDQIMQLTMKKNLRFFFGGGGGVFDYCEWGN